jgi:hypothetical protein
MKKISVYDFEDGADFLSEAVKWLNHQGVSKRELCRRAG